MSDDLEIGRLVKNDKNLVGLLHYVGPIHVSPNPDQIWCGIEIVKAEGKNNGSVKEVEYFKCLPQHGLFLKREAIVGYVEPKNIEERKLLVRGTKLRQQSNSNPDGEQDGEDDEDGQASPAGRNGTNGAARDRNSTEIVKAKTNLFKETIVPVSSSTQRPSARPTAVSRQSLASSTTRPVPATKSSTLSKPQSTQNSRITISGPSSTVKAAVSASTRPVVRQVPSSLTTKRDAASAAVAQTRAAKGHVIVPRLPTPQAERESQNEGRNEDDQKVSLEREARLPANTATGKQGPDSNAQDIAPAFVPGVSREQFERLKTEHQARIDELEALLAQDKTRSKALEQKCKELVQRVNAAEKAAKEADSELSELETKVEDAELDRQLADARADDIQAQYDELKYQYDELQGEANILKEEHDEITSSMTADERANAGWRSMQKENERLRAALVALRDLSRESEESYKEEIKGLKEDLDRAEEFEGKFYDLEVEKARLDDVYVELKEQLEAVEDQSEVIERLLSDKENLSRKTEALEKYVLELEELADTNEELLQEYNSNEKSNLNRIDTYQALAHEQERAINDRENQVEDLEYTLSKFRSVIQGLQGDIDDARRMREISETQANEMSARSEAMMVLQLQNNKTAAKSARRQVETDILRSEAHIAGQEVEILNNYLPDDFDDHRAGIQAYLQFIRLKDDARIVANMLTDRINDRGLSTGTTYEESLATFEVVHFMQWFGHTAQLFERYIHESCPLEEFGKFQQVNGEIDSIVRAAHMWIQALKNDELSGDGPEQLKMMQNVMLDMIDKLLPRNTINTRADELLYNCACLRDHAATTTSLLSWLAKVIQAKLGLPTDEDSDSIHLDRKLDQLITRSRTIAYIGGKLIQELTATRQRKQCLVEATWPTFSSILDNSEAVNLKAVQTLALELCRTLISSESPSYADLVAILDTAFPLNNTEREERNITSHLINLHALTDDLLTLATSAPKTKFDTVSPPWTIHAKALREKGQHNASTTASLLEARSTITTLVAQLADRSKYAEELAIRAELAEKRIKDSIVKDQQEKLRSAISQLETEKHDLSQELVAAKREVENAEKQMRLQLEEAKKNAAQDASTPRLSGTSNAQEDFMIKIRQAQIDECKAYILQLENSVRFLSDVNRQLTMPTSEIRLNITKEWLTPIKAHKTAGQVENERKKNVRDVKRRRADDELMEFVGRAKSVRFETGMSRKGLLRQERDVYRLKERLVGIRS